MSSNLFLPPECRQSDPWDYNTSEEWMQCRKKALKISLIIISVVVVIIVVLVWLFGSRSWAYIIAAGGAFLILATALLGKRGDEQKYADMTRDLAMHLRHVNKFPYEEFSNQKTNLIDIIKYGEKIGDDELDREIDEAYKEFIKQKQEDKRAAAQAQAIVSSSRSRYSRGPTISLF